MNKITLKFYIVVLNYIYGNSSERPNLQRMADDLIEEITKKQG